MPTPSASEPLTARVDPALVERFRRDVERSLGYPPGEDKTLALAVSGGADSFAMLALAHAAYPGRIIAATVDHRLRAENASEASMVSTWCGSHAIPHQTLAVDVPPDNGENLQSWARQERYGLLRKWAAKAGAFALCTAHHADDQAETFLMRAARGSGLSGLAAVRARIEDEVLVPNGPGWTPNTTGICLALAAHRLILLRPLLDWRRVELRAAAAQLPFANDASNTDLRFDRVRVRAFLAEAPWLDAVKISRSAQHLAETDRDLFALSRWLWEQRVQRDNPYEEVIDVADLPRELRRRLARIALDGVRMSNGIVIPIWTYASDIEPLLDALDAGGSATQAGVLVIPTGDQWRFCVAPPRRHA